MTAAELRPRVPQIGAPRPRSAVMRRLAADRAELAAQRRCFPADSQARLRALLTEIDEVVLPRLLHLCVDAREVGHLVVSHRRLVDIVVNGRSAAVGDSDDLAARCAAALGAIAQMRGRLSAFVTRRDGLRDPRERACAVAALEVELGLSDTPHGFDDLVRRVEALAMARVWWSDIQAPMQFRGAPEWAGALRTYAGRCKGMGNRPCADGHIRKSRIEGVVIPMSAQEVLVMASSNGAGFAAVLPRQAGLDALATCRFA